MSDPVSDLHRCGRCGQSIPPSDGATPHPYRSWVTPDEDVGMTCCLAPRTDPIHVEPTVLEAERDRLQARVIDLLNESRTAYLEALSSLRAKDALIEELRGDNRDGYDNGFTTGYEEIRSQLRTAQATVERLRGELERIAKWWQTPNPTSEPTAIARAALEEK